MNGRIPATHRRAACALVGSVCILALGLAGCSRSDRRQQRAGDEQGSAGAEQGGIPGAGAAMACSFSPPFTHKNLSIFLIRGPDRVKKDRRILTLEEALKQKKVVVHETEDVDELEVENRSDEEVFINSGDIVKGGKQDRCFGCSVLLPPRSGKVKVGSFCVERGRWSGRGGESMALFSSSTEQIVGNRMKMAAKVDNDQGSVWNGASDIQVRMADNASALLNLNVGSANEVAAGLTFVTATTSPSSLQLTLEHPNVKKMRQEYIDKLADIPEGKGDVIGYAVAINGKVVSADVYASSDLFRRLWPKLLKSSATEAVAEFEKDKTFDGVTADNIRTCMDSAEKGEAYTKTDPSGMNIEVRKADRQVYIRSADANGATFHGSFMLH
ncbi:MAG TPA: DUF6569 family protein [Phycisphaerae bacterium]|nr:DUF6569 family protein [Phycisphaerae bacterium]HUT58212.1 DUF6569 family protein [Phycisphaerae bacterium]